jgi:hypothetical protein
MPLLVFSDFEGTDFNKDLPLHENYQKPFSQSYSPKTTSFSETRQTTYILTLAKALMSLVFTFLCGQVCPLGKVTRVSMVLSPSFAN